MKLLDFQWTFSTLDKKNEFLCEKEHSISQLFTNTNYA